MNNPLRSGTFWMFSLFSTDFPGGAPLAKTVQRIGPMLAIVLSLLFGLAAFAALAEIHASVIKGARHGRLILAEMAIGERAAGRPRAVLTPVLLPPRLAAA